jgi:hypothetical protein
LLPGDYHFWEPVFLTEFADPQLYAGPIFSRFDIESRIKAIPSQRKQFSGKRVRLGRVSRKICVNATRFEIIATIFPTMTHAKAPQRATVERLSTSSKPQRKLSER